MTFSNSSRRLLGRATGRTTKGRKPSRRFASRKLHIESLEHRIVLSAAPVFDSALGVAVSGSPWGTAVDAAGNMYVTGTLFKTSDFDPNRVWSDGADILTPRGSQDAFVAKYDPNNSLVWARRMGGDHIFGSIYGANDPMDGAYSIAVDASGNAYVVGQFVGQADFGLVTLTSAGDSDAFVAKLDPDGNVAWANRWGTAKRDFGKGIAVDAGGNVLAASTACTVYTNGSYTQNGIEMRKFSPTGTGVWTKQISGSGASAEGGVATDTAGNMYVSGRFAGTVDFNPDPKKTNYVTGSSTLGNGYVLKLTAAGGFGWVSPFIAKTTESSNAFILDIAADPAGNIVVGGYYNGQIDFNPSAKVDFRLPNYSTLDGFVAKLSTNGALSWATPLGSGYIYSIAVDATGVYAGGSFSEVLHPGFGLPDVAGNGIGHMFVSHFTNAGAVDWALTNDGTGSAGARGIAVDANGTVYVDGTYSAYNGKLVDFDPDPVGTYELTTPTAASQMFLLKLRTQSAARLTEAAVESPYYAPLKQASSALRVRDNFWSSQARDVEGNTRDLSYTVGASANRSTDNSRWASDNHRQSEVDDLFTQWDSDPLELLTLPDLGM